MKGEESDQRCMTSSMQRFHDIDVTHSRYKLPHIVSTKSIGRAIVRLERQQPPANGLTTAIER